MGQNRQIRLEDINLISVLIDILRNIWVPILIGAAAWMAVGTYSTLTYVPQYTSTVTFAVSTRGSTTALSSLNLTSGMAEIFSTVFESDVLKSEVGEAMGTPNPNYEITAEVIPETNLLRVSVTAGSPEQAFRALSYTLDNYESISEYMFQNAILTVLKDPNVPMVPSNQTDTGKTQKEAAAAGAVLAILIIAFISASRETVQTRAGARHNLEGELYGSISHDAKYIDKQKLKALQEEEGINVGKGRRGRRRIKTAALITNPLVSFHFREDCQKLTARLDYSMRHRKEKILLVSSAGENEGKSTIAANLALALHSRERRVLVIDCDFRKPAMQKIFEIKAGIVPDMAEYILDENGTTSAQDYIVDVDGVHLAINYHSYDVPQRLITSGRMKEFLNELSGYYDNIIIDSPPMLVATDAEALTEVTDTSILVVRQDWTTVRDINDCINVLQNGKARFAGYVLNNFQKGGKKQRVKARVSEEE